MRCKACDFEYNQNLSNRCPHCGMDYVEFVSGTPEENRQQLELLARQYRNKYLADLRVGIVAMQWKSDGEFVVKDRESVVYFAEGRELLQGEVWCRQQFARIPDEKILQVTMAVNKDGKEHLISINLPNLQQAELQQVGVRLTDKLYAQLLLRNSSAVTSSENIML